MVEGTQEGDEKQRGQGEGQRMAAGGGHIDANVAEPSGNGALGGGVALEA